MGWVPPPQFIVLIGNLQSFFTWREKQHYVCRYTHHGLSLINAFSWQQNYRAIPSIKQIYLCIIVNMYSQLLRNLLRQDVGKNRFDLQNTRYAASFSYWNIPCTTKWTHSLLLIILFHYSSLDSSYADDIRDGMLHYLSYSSNLLPSFIALLAYT